MLSALLHHKSSRSSHRQPQPDAQILSVAAPHSEEISQEMSGVSARQFTEILWVGDLVCFQISVKCNRYSKAIVSLTNINLFCKNRH